MQHTQCCRCSYVLMPHEGHDQHGITLCDPCYEKTTIVSGEHLYALRLWLMHNQNAFTKNDLPSFWPRNAHAQPLSVLEIMHIALGTNILDLPCGHTCVCDHIARPLHTSKAITSTCFFHDMEKTPLRTLLLLYWWHIHYRKSSFHPDFWPKIDDHKILSPQLMVASVLQ